MKEYLWIRGNTSRENPPDVYKEGSRWFFYPSGEEITNPERKEELEQAFLEAHKGR